MNNNQSNIERVVMRRVHTIHVLRPILSSTALAALIFIVALWGIGREVWVAKVFQNAPQGLFGESRYFIYAFNHTRLIVQALTLLSFASVIYIAREMARLLTVTFTPVRA